MPCHDIAAVLAAVFSINAEASVAVSVDYHTSPLSFCSGIWQGQVQGWLYACVTPMLTVWESIDIRLFNTVCFFFPSTRLLLFMTTSLHHPYNSIYMLKRLLDWKNGHFDLHSLHYRTLPSYAHIIPTAPKTMPESHEIFKHNNNPAI